MTIGTVEIPENSEVFGETRNAFARFGYSAAVRAKGLLFIAGTIGRRSDGSIPDSIQEQTEAAIRRIEEILHVEDLDLRALVDVTSYHVDIHQHLPGFSEAKQRLIKPPYPAWSMIGVSGLASPGLLVEIRATAAYPDASR
ncbi:Rid family hydrolase [Amycolatopsis sp. MEPSY49]|uniref:Rid family hydrolase n=1 Tax=Amycolatopsis sp. MEPSY49 TaxID=3151600 RepID=UPI003EF1C5F4